MIRKNELFRYNSTLWVRRTLITQDIIYITEKLSSASSLEIITNGDPLSSKLLNKIYKANAHRVLVSMYDGPEQIENLKK